MNELDFFTPVIVHPYDATRKVQYGVMIGKYYIDRKLEYYLIAWDKDSTSALGWGFKYDNLPKGDSSVNTSYPPEEELSIFAGRKCYFIPINYIEVDLVYTVDELIEQLRWNLK